jgi:dynactin 1
VRSGDSLSENESGRSALVSPNKSDEDIMSPVQARTQALNRLTSGGTAASSPKTPATTKSPAPSGGALQKENQDLKTKLRILEEKRAEDREQLKELQKLQDQLEKIANINKKIEGKFQSTAQDNAGLKKQLKEAEERLASVDSMQAEHDSVLELATLDREMAEETADALRYELDTIKQKVEELELEVEVLREENAEFEEGVTAEDRTSENWIKKERQIERLTEALYALHDRTTATRENLEADVKALKQDLEDHDKMKQEYDICKEKLLLSEDRAEDLKEQLENALGAEDIIEKLSDENAQQSDVIAALRDTIKDLEELKEINDELEINHIEHEKELDKIIEDKNSVIYKQAQQVADQNKDIDDMQYTLVKFKELVSNLQKDLQDMEASHALNEAETEQLNSNAKTLQDLNHKLTINAAKTQVKTIDLELQRMRAQEAQMHLEILKFFLPDSYEQDKFSVDTLLRFGRLTFKVDIVHSFVSERVSGRIHPGHEDDIFAGCDAMNKLSWVKAMCNRFLMAISHCSLEEFTKYGDAMFEVAVVERALDSFIDGLKRDEFSEKQCGEELSRSIAVMTHLAEVYIPNDLPNFANKIYMQMALVQSYLDSAATTFATMLDMVQRVIPAIGEEDQVYKLFNITTGIAISQTRTAKVIASKPHRALEELKARNLSLNLEDADPFEECESTAQQLADMAEKIALAVHELTSEEGRAQPLTYSEVERTIHKTVLSSFSASETELYGTYHNRLRVLTGQLSDLAAVCGDLSQTQEFELTEEPWVLRANELKALKIKPVDVEEELHKLKEQYKAARQEIAKREEDLSTSAVHIEHLDKRIREANAKASRITDLEAQILDAQTNMAKLKDDMEKQDRELKVLETDRDQWKKMAGDTRALVGLDDGSGAGGAGREKAVATAREMDALRNDIASLQQAVRYLRDDNRRARTKEQHHYDWLSEPLRKPMPVVEQRKALVVAEGKDVLRQLLNMASSAKVYDLKSLPEDKLAWKPAKSTPQYHAAKQAEDYAAWKSWQNAVVGKAKVVAGAQTGRREGSEQREMLRKAAARLKIQLPDDDGKVVYGRGDVQVVGSREWEGLQGRVAL